MKFLKTVCLFSRSRLMAFLLAGLLSVISTSGFGGQIHEFAQQGDLAGIKAQIKQDPSLINAKDKDGRTPLHWACRGVHFDVVKFLVENGADVNVEDNNKTTPLHSLAYRGHKDGLKILLSKGADANIKDYTKHTPLHYAAISDSHESAALLIAKGANLESKNDYERTPLLLCARERGGVKTAELFLKAGADINAKDKYGDTPIALAAWRGKKDMVDLLLDNGAALPAEDQEARYFFFEAARHGLTRLFQTLMKKGGDPTFRLSNGGTLIHSAAAGGGVGILESLLTKGMNISQKDDYGWTPLHYAARDGRTEAVEWLLKKGADINVRNSMGQSPLNVADEMNQTKIREVLIAKGAETGPTQFPVLEGDYLGQNPPGEEPERFATGIVSSIWGLHSTVAFSPDGNLALWAPMVEIPGQIYSTGGIMMMERKNGRWSLPQWAPFSGEIDGDVPFFSPDGNRIYFMSTRALPDNPESRKERIWYVDKTREEWSHMKPVDSVVNDYPHHWQFSVDNQHTIYFSSNVPEGTGGGDLYCSKYEDGKWQMPVNLGSPINTTKGEGMPYIAPDGSYLIFQRDLDLYISFHKEGSGWTPAKILGAPINSPGFELCPIVTPDGKYLFFLSTRGGESHAWWVDAGFIERMKSQ